MSKQEMLRYTAQLEKFYGYQTCCIYDTIILFKLNECQEKIIRGGGASVSKILKLFCTDVIEDLYGIPSFLAFMNPIVLSKCQLKELYEFWEESTSQKIVFLAQPQIPIPGNIRSWVKVIPDILEDIENLKLLILNQMVSLDKKDRNLQKYQSRIFRLVAILKMLKTRQIVPIADIAEEFQVSTRTAQRDMNLLMELGEPIWYDPEKKGYGLLTGESFLWPD